MSDEASSKFEELIANLQQKLELTGLEIADILWLAQQNKTTVEKTSTISVEQKQSQPSNTQEESQDDNNTPDDTAPSEKKQSKPSNTQEKSQDDNNKPDDRVPAVTPQITPQAEVVKPSRSVSTSSSSSDNTLDIKVPDAPGLREPLKLARALRPLIQRIDSQTEIILDEEATTNRIADERIRIPVFQPAQEPAFDLMLVVDESNTMIFWRKAIQELHKLFKIQGAFRDVQVWAMRTSQEEKEKGEKERREKEQEIYLVRGTGKKARKYRHCQPRSLIDPSGKRLFLVASDCVTDIWHNGKGFEMLKIWAQKHPVAIIQMLPQWLWQRTGLSLGAKVQFSSLNPRVPNQDLLIKTILLWDDIDFRTGTKIPIFTLEEDSARTWSKMIGGRGDAHVTGFVFPPNLEDFIPFTLPEEDSSTLEIEEPETTEEITSNFRRTASPMARKLASLLSAAPIITLPIVRIVQDQMLPQSQQVHVAEVFLGGIIKRKQTVIATQGSNPNEITPETNPDEIEFDFINEDVRDNFLQAAPVTDSLEIIEVISKYFAKKLNKTLLEFNALLRKPQQLNEENKEEIKPFALLSAKVLKRLGGDYVQFAEGMERGWNYQKFEDEENHPLLGAGKIYALLVGIDEYHKDSQVRNLRGCVNDIKAIQEYLNHAIATKNKIATENETGDTWELVTKELLDQSATRQAVIDGFEQHLCQADSNDVVLFYYAGCGSQEPAPEIFRNLKVELRGDKIQTIVCHDSRTSGVTDLADEELIYLIEKVAKNNPHILIILDSPHSGFWTRNTKVVERQTNPNTQRIRDLKDFIFPQEWLNYRSSDSYKPPRYVAIAACRDFETAREHKDSDGQSRGVLSYFLTETLQRTNGTLSYANLIKDINALITGKVRDQSPQIKARPEDLIKTFLGGSVAERVNYFTLTYNKKEHRSWVISGGLLHGIRPISEGKTSLAIFPQGSKLEDLQDIDKAICKAEVTQVMTEASKVELFDEKIELFQEEAYWAVITDVPLPNLKVFFKGDEAGKNIVLNVFDQDANKFVAKTDTQKNADYYLEADKGQYWIVQPSDNKPLVAPVPEIPDTQGYTQQRAKQIIKRLEHIARWKNILELKTPPTSRIKAGDVEMEVIVTSGDDRYSSKTETSALRGEYNFKDNKFDSPLIKIKVTNQSKRDLYFQVLELEGNYAINFVSFFGQINCIHLPSETIQEGEILKVGIPNAYLNNGVTEYDTIFKLIVSNREFDASLLEQPGLDSPPPVNYSTRF